MTERRPSRFNSLVNDLADVAREAGTDLAKAIDRQSPIVRRVNFENGIIVVGLKGVESVLVFAAHVSGGRKPHHTS